MKKIIVTCIIVVCLTAAFGYAQMGGDMDAGEMGGMGDFGDMGMKQYDTMQGQGMEDMMQLMSQMASMMRQVSSLMRRDLSPTEMRELSDITSDMSSEMSEMSGFMGGKNLAPGKMQDLQWKMGETEDRLNRMR